MQFDPTANFSSNCAFETRREVAVEITREKSKLKTKAMNGVSNKLKQETREEECEAVSDDALCKPPNSDAVAKKIEVDPFVSLSMEKFVIPQLTHSFFTLHRFMKSTAIFCTKSFIT